MSHSQLQWKTKTSRAPRIRPEEWETHKAELGRLYNKLTLEDLMVSMKIRHRFTPSRAQYLLQFQKWNIHKYQKTEHSQNDLSGQSPAKETRSPGTSMTLSGIGGSDSIRNSPTTDSSFSLSPSFQASGLLSANATIEADQSMENKSAQGQRAPTSDINLWGKRKHKDRTALEPPAKRSKDTETCIHQAQAQSCNISLRGRGLRPVVRPKPRHLIVLPRYPSVTAPTPRNTATTANHSYPAMNQPSYSDSILKWTVWGVSSAATRSEDQSLPLDSIFQAPVSDTPEPEKPCLPTEHSESDLLSETESTIDEDEQPLIEACPANGIQIPSSNNEEIRAVLDITAKLPVKHLSSAELLHYAQLGGCLEEFNYEHVREMKKAADFFFGARCPEDAFIIYLMIYRCLRTFSEVSAKATLSAVVDLARSSANLAQDEIVRHILAETLQSQQAVAEDNTPGKFLVHSFLALICRKQGDLMTAESHCQQALQHFDSRAHRFSELSKDWRPFAMCAYKHLDILRHREGRIQTSETFSTELLCKATDLSLVEDGTERPRDRNKQCFLRLLLHWSLLALHTSPTYGAWQNLESSGEEGRDVEVTSIYCHLWEKWQHDGSVAVKNQFNSFLQQTAGVSITECIATISFMISEACSPNLDHLRFLGHMGINREQWSTTFENHVRNKALDGIGRLLQLADAEIAHAFSRAYSTQQFAGRDTIATNNVFGHLRTDYVRAFAARAIELDLPDLQIDESSIKMDDLYAAYDPPQQPYLGPPLNPSLSSSDSCMSSGLASMKSLKQHIRNEVMFGIDRARNQMPAPNVGFASFSSLSNPDLFEGVEHSLRSLSMASDSVQRSIREWESRFGSESRRSLVSVRSQSVLEADSTRSAVSVES